MKDKVWLGVHSGCVWTEGR